VDDSDEIDELTCFAIADENDKTKKNENESFMTGKATDRHV
jgi:hypothetical protein